MVVAVILLWWRFTLNRVKFLNGGETKFIVNCLAIFDNDDMDQVEGRVKKTQGAGYKKLYFPYNTDYKCDCL